MLKKLILEYEEKLLQPEVRQSKEQLDRLLADDFFEFGSSGTVWTKQNAISGSGLTVREMNLTHFEIYPLAEDVVLCTYQIEDRTRRQHTLRSSIWRNINGDWRMFFHQGTVMLK